MNYLPQPIADKIHEIRIQHNVASHLETSLTYDDVITIFREMGIFISVTPDVDHSTQEIFDDVWIATVYTPGNFSPDQYTTSFQEGVKWAINWIYINLEI